MQIIEPQSGVATGAAAETPVSGMEVTVCLESVQWFVLEDPMYEDRHIDYSSFNPTIGAGALEVWA